MIENIESIKKEAESRISTAPNLEELDKLRVHYLGKKGLVTNLLHQLKEISGDKRKEFGAILNQLKQEFETKISLRHQELENQVLASEISPGTSFDFTLPGYIPSTFGSLHPITSVIEEIVTCFQRVGFSVVTGPEVETDYYNFEALNTPSHHPARDMQDTFYLKEGTLLRSHTSPMQIRTMKKHRPPLQFLSIGRVYRADYDATHSPMFHQIEGVMVDEGISFSDLKGLIHYLIKELFGDRPIRFRPSYFPFVEPGAEVDVQLSSKSGDWLEILGCGMIHPNLFKHVDYDPDRYSGFAFGIGVERVAMLKYGIKDIRSFYENDLRFLEQF